MPAEGTKSFSAATLAQRDAALAAASKSLKYVKPTRMVPGALPILSG
jgi:hypothetical protein